MGQADRAPIAVPGGRPRARFDRLVDRVLRSRFHRLASGRHVLVTYRGRRTGVEHSFPVQYARAGRAFVIRAGRPEQKRWWRNFRTPWPVTLLHRGATVPGIGLVVRGESDDGVRLAAAYFERFPGSGRQGGLRPRKGAAPDHEAVRRAAAGMVFVLVTPQGWEHGIPA